MVAPKGRPLISTPGAVKSDTTGPQGRTRILGLAVVLLVAAALRLWRLEQNGFDNEYYAAAVLSMTQSWHNFFYNAFDPAGFVSVDKPPVALWIQVASVKLFGFNCWSLLLPQVLEALGSVALVGHLVRRRFGIAAGLLAGLFMAVTPVSVAIDRSGNTDTCLVLVLLLAAWALIRAAEKASRPLLLLSMALLGLGFNVKMMAALVVLPTFVLVYLLAAAVDWRRRLIDLTLSAVVLLALSLPWILVYDLTPIEDRPYVGSSKQNSMVELAVGHNALGRFIRPIRTPIDTGLDGVSKETGRPSSTSIVSVPLESRLRALWRRQFVVSPVGPMRLVNGQLAAQVGWLFPLAIIGLATGLRGISIRRPLTPAPSALILWSGWALTYGIVYSYAGGIFHFYYLATMAPPLAALAAIGVVRLWESILKPGWSALALPVTLLVTAAWQITIQWTALGLKPESWRFEWLWLHLTLVNGTLLAALTMFVVLLRGVWSRLTRRLALGALGVGLLALLVNPLAWALSSVLVRGVPVLPSADLYRIGAETITPQGRERIKAGQQAMTKKLVDFLQRNRSGEGTLLVTSSTRLAAPIIIQTSQAVMARGGFHGLDPILTPEKLARMAERRQIRFVMLGDLSPIDRMLGGEIAGRPVADWVRQHGRAVEPDLWRYDQSVVGRLARRMEGMSLYDLRPEAGIVTSTFPGLTTTTGK
ncbi:MAG: glycosyltransferase family 39 protein [Pseudomonadota bacterium]